MTVVTRAGNRCQCEGVCGSKHDPNRLRKQGRCENADGQNVSKVGVIRLVAMPRQPERESDFVTAARLGADHLIAMCPPCYDAVKRRVKAVARNSSPPMDDLFDTAPYRVASSGGAQL
jgi:hypothetical protein